MPYPQRSQYVNTGRVTGYGVTDRRGQQIPDTQFVTPADDGSEVGTTYPGFQFLPVDAPPITSRLPEVALQGLAYQATLAGGSPTGYPWAPYVTSDQFPLARPSYAAEQPVVGTRIGIATNEWSPVAHYWARANKEELTAVPVTPRPFSASSKGYKRLRGRVTTFPFAVAQWKTVQGRIVS